MIDDTKCYETVRQMRWPEGVNCVWCQSEDIKRRGRHLCQRARQRYHCKACQRDFDDLTETIFAHHHQPLRKCIVCLYLLGLNLSNEQIAQELGLNKDDVHQMTVQLRSGVVERKPEPQLEGVVECDEVYLVAGHKGQPEAVKKKAAADAAAD
jgi:transposase-like protein